jgi:MFS family permease
VTTVRGAGPPTYVDIHSVGVPTEVTPPARHRTAVVRHRRQGRYRPSHRRKAFRDGLYGNGDFIKFWVGETVSLYGTQITVLALPLTAVLVLGAGPEQLGVLRFLQMVPYLLFGVLFGIWVDRMRRRPIMLAANLVRLVLIGMVPILAGVGRLNLTILFVITFGAGVAAVLFDVSWMSFVPAIVRDKQYLVEANAKLGASSSSADAAGPGIAGGLIGAVGAPAAMAVNAGTFLVSLISLLLIGTPEPASTTSGTARRRFFGELTEGMRWVFGNRYLRVIALVGGSCNFITAAVQSMFVLYAVQDLGFPPAMLGLVLSVGAAGGVGGALVAARLVSRYPLGRLYVLSLLVAFAAMASVPAAQGPRYLLEGMLIVAFFLSYAGISVGNIVVLSLRQTITPGRLLGRMNAAMRTLMFGLGALGGPVAGVLAAVVGVHGSLWVSAAASVLVLVPIALSPVGRLREMPPAAE